MFGIAVFFPTFSDKIIRVIRLSDNCLMWQIRIIRIEEVPESGIQEHNNLRWQIRIIWIEGMPKSGTQHLVGKGLSSK